MSHGIVLPIDRVLSTAGPEWHGLATQVPIIGDTEASQLFFDIREMEVGGLIDGEMVRMDRHKALVADYRTCRPDLVALETGEADGSTVTGLHKFVPLHIPRHSYKPIDNRAVWNSMKDAMKEAGIDGEVTSAGTLEAGKKFFISLAISGEEGFSVNANGTSDKFLANLNFIASHDGTTGVKAYDSTIRIVCMNTFRASLQAAGEVDFVVYHTQGSDGAMRNLGPLVGKILAGRETFRNQLEYLASLPCTAQEAEQIALGYFVAATSKKELAKQSLNAADEISTLFCKGKGNNGRTMYDLFNGLTEYYTHGPGTGKKASKAEKVTAANFGAAADHKEAFANLLFSEETRQQMLEAGREAQSLAIQAGTL